MGRIYTPAAFQMVGGVGSGPAGVACAHALLQQGARVTMLDAGLDLESDRKASVAHLRSTSPQSWDAPSLRFIREGVSVEAGGIPLKMAYGSPLPYQEPAPLPLAPERLVGKPRFALGRLGQAWGGSALTLPSPSRDHCVTRRRGLARVAR